MNVRSASFRDLARGIEVPVAMHAYSVAVGDQDVRRRQTQHAGIQRLNAVQLSIRKTFEDADLIDLIVDEASSHQRSQL